LNACHDSTGVDNEEEDLPDEDTLNSTFSDPEEAAATIFEVRIPISLKI
jgi:hypothetical protein